MSGTPWLPMWQVEFRKLMSRASARVGLVLLMAMSMAPVLVLYYLDDSAAEFNGVPMAEMWEGSAPKALLWTLSALHRFGIMPAFIALLGALSFAGELQGKTLREDLLRPVSRMSVLLTKWAALSAYVALATLLSWLVCAVFGAILFGTEGEWSLAIQAWSVSVLCDCGFAALVLLVAGLVRSVASTIVGVVLFVVFDTVLGWALSAVSMVGEAIEAPVALEVAIQARPWLPSSAFGVWSTFGGTDPWVWQNFAALAGITFGALSLATMRFNRMDVP